MNLDGVASTRNQAHRTERTSLERDGVTMAVPRWIGVWQLSPRRARTAPRSREGVRTTLGGLMRIGIAGAGPAGLLFAHLAKCRRPDIDVRVVEQNARDATFGFGVVFSHGALEFLARDVPAMHASLATLLETWPIQRIVHCDTAVDIDGNGFCAIGRLTLLQLLQRECETVGVTLMFGTRLESPDSFSDCDLIVAADGINSIVRRAHRDAFRPTIEWLTNKFIWYGTTKPFECLTLTFRETEHGAFVAHHYRYAPDRSTFIVECDAATWHRAGFGAMDDAESRASCERIFARDLDGHPLIANRSAWRNCPLIRCANWSAGNTVLIGDALRTGHFSIGSGTRLAFDDAIALDRALAEAGDDIAHLLAAFERERRPIVDKLVTAANASSFWYERMTDKMAFEPIELAYDYMTRSGRISDERLSETAPRFMAEVRAHLPHRQCRIDDRIVDPVPDDAPGAREIGFVTPERYNASQLLYDNLATRPDKIAVVCKEHSLTYRDLCALADRAGNGLAAMGLARGGRVLMLLDDSPEYAAAIFGAIRAGFVPVLVNTLSPPELVAYFLQDSGAEAAFVDARTAALLAHDGVASSRLRQVVHVGDDAANAMPPLALHHRWTKWIEEQSSAECRADTHRDAMAFWMYSSGSTGRPKGVVHLQHDALYTYLAYGRGVLGINESDIVFSPPKSFFAYGFGNSLTFPFAAGATVVLMPGRPEPEAVFAAIERHRPTILFGLPTLYVAMAAHPGSERRNLSSLRLCVSAAETLSGELFDEWRRRYGLSIVEGLGSTEVLHIYLSNALAQQKPGASGKRVPGYELKLTDNEGSEIAPGESGVLWVRGHSQSPCYWSRPDKTAETMRNGWIYTGDRFSCDSDGFYVLEGRADDLIKVSGQWVHPLEVERCLAEHPLVRECAVLALDDENRLKTLVAFVALHDQQRRGDATTRALQAFVKERLLPYKYPRRMVYVEALPKTGTGKIDRQALKNLP
jgi:benzoate-CoA ligase family protein